MEPAAPSESGLRRPVLSGWLVIGLMGVVAIAPISIAAFAAAIGQDLTGLIPQSIWRPAGFAAGLECLGLRGRGGPFNTGHLAANYIILAVIWPISTVVGVGLGIRSVFGNPRFPVTSALEGAKHLGVLALVGGVAITFGLDMWNLGGLVSFWLCEHNDGRYWIFSLPGMALSLALFSVLNLATFALLPMTIHALFRSAAR